MILQLDSCCNDCTAIFFDLNGRFSYLTYRKLEKYIFFTFKDGRGLMLWLLSCPPGFTCWISFAPVFSLFTVESLSARRWVGLQTL